jgi:hypothetical protein
LLALAGCHKTGPTSFTLQLKAKYGNQNFEINSVNTDQQGRYIDFTTLKFYLSHINLIKTDGSLVKVSDVAIFDFSDTTNLSVTVNNIQGDFSGISFVCGLDSLTNDTTTPRLYSAPNPLSGDYGMAWLMLNYQFEVLEAKWDTTPGPVYHNALLYHIGTNAAYRQTVLNKSFTVKDNPYNMVIYLDAAQIFNNNTTGENLNIVTQGSTMSGSTDNPTVLTTFCNNFSHAFTF